MPDLGQVQLPATNATHMPPLNAIVAAPRRWVGEDGCLENDDNFEFGSNSFRDFTQFDRTLHYTGGNSHQHNNEDDEEREVKSADFSAQLEKLAERELVAAWDALVSAVRSEEALQQATQGKRTGWNPYRPARGGPQLRREVLNSEVLEFRSVIPIDSLCVSGVSLHLPLEDETPDANIAVIGVSGASPELLDQRSADFSSEQGIDLQNVFAAGVPSSCFLPLDNDLNQLRITGTRAQLNTAPPERVLEEEEVLVQHGVSPAEVLAAHVDQAPQRQQKQQPPRHDQRSVTVAAAAAVGLLSPRSTILREVEDVVFEKVWNEVVVPLYVSDNSNKEQQKQQQARDEDRVTAATRFGSHRQDTGISSSRQRRVKIADKEVSHALRSSVFGTLSPGNNASKANTGLRPTTGPARRQRISPVYRGVSPGGPGRLNALRQRSPKRQTQTFLPEATTSSSLTAVAVDGLADSMKGLANNTDGHHHPVSVEDLEEQQQQQQQLLQQELARKALTPASQRHHSDATMSLNESPIRSTISPQQTKQQSGKGKQQQQQQSGRTLHYTTPSNSRNASPRLGPIPTQVAAMSPMACDESAGQGPAPVRLGKTSTLFSQQTKKRLIMTALSRSRDARPAQDAAAAAARNTSTSRAPRPDSSSRRSSPLSQLRQGQMQGSPNYTRHQELRPLGASLSKDGLLRANGMTSPQGRQQQQQQQQRRRLMPLAAAGEALLEYTSPQSNGTEPHRSRTRDSDKLETTHPRGHLVRETTELKEDVPGAKRKPARPTTAGL